MRAQDRSVQVMIDGYRTWRATRLLEVHSGVRKGGHVADPGV